LSQFIDQDSKGIVPLERDHRDFPRRFLEISNPPETIWIKGKIPPAPRVALVGARRCDRYGMDLARTLAEDLVDHGVAIVSGGAAGIDTAALTACQEHGGFPVAILGTGVDIVYPASNKDLFESIARKGAIISEYPPGTPGRPGNFPRRNRLVSALSDAVIVVRAQKKSGSLITARLAVSQRKPLFAVPGPVGQSLSEGCHQLIRDGARLLESAGDVLSVLGLSSGHGQTNLDLGRKSPVTATKSIPVDLDPEERLLMEALEPGPLPLDVLSHKTGLDISRLSGLVLKLELKNLVKQGLGLVSSCLVGTERSGKVR